jgi:hypothetical protein
MTNGKWNRSGRRWQLLALISIVICVIVGVTVAFGRDAVAQQPPAATPPAAPPQAQAPAKPSVNAVAQAAVKMGVLSCVSRINQVATFLTDGTQSGVFIFNPNQQSPDQHVFTASFEMVRPDSSAFYATASFFPNRDAVYDTVEYVNMTCEQVEKTVFKDLKRKGIVKKNIIVLDGGSVKVFLMPAGTGTVVIKKEVVQ